MPAGQRSVCVTGGTGFIGGHLIAALESAGGSPPRVLTRHGFSGSGEGLAATVIRGDLLDGEAARRLVSRGASVVNLAFARAASAEVNRAMAINLADACLAAPAVHVVHCSTAVVTGRAEVDAVNETVPCRPVTGYQASKLDIEEIFRERLAGRCPLTILRPTAVFGSGGENLRAQINALRRRPWLLNAAAATLFAERRLHLSCVENVVAAFRFVLERGAELDGEVFIVSDDEAPENNYREVLNIAARQLGKRPFPRWRLPFGQALAGIALRLAGSDDPNPRRTYSSHKLRERGFNPPLELADGVRRFACEYAAASAEVG